jgi:RHS repeat-associated protein
MGCFKLEAYRNREEHSFMGVWKKSDQEKEAANYYPFGAVAQSYSRENSVPNKYLYQGKERITDLGIDEYDFGPRWYDPWACRTNVHDPLAEKFYSWSPYSWAFNNPTRFSDPTGMAPLDVTLGGMEKDKTLQQINSAVQGITVTMADNGKLSYTTNQGQTLNESATKLTQAIDDHSVDVNINTTYNAQNSNGGALVGGSFMGTKVESDGTAKSTNEYDAPTGGRIDAAYKKPGGTVMHEITEGYEAAKMSQKSGQSSGPDGTPGSVYGAAHKAALKQPGSSITLTHYNNAGSMMNPIYDSKGRDITPSDASYHGTVWRAKGQLVHVISR